MEWAERLALHRKSRAVWSRKCTTQCRFFWDFLVRFWLDLSLRSWFILLLTSTLLHLKLSWHQDSIARKQWLQLSSVNIDPWQSSAPKLSKNRFYHIDIYRFLCNQLLVETKSWFVQVILAQLSLAYNLSSINLEVCELLMAFIWRTEIFCQPHLPGNARQSTSVLNDFDTYGIFQRMPFLFYKSESSFITNKHNAKPTWSRYTRVYLHLPLQSVVLILSVDKKDKILDVPFSL